MPRGESHFALLFIAGDTTKPDIVVPKVNPIPECCFILPLFGNEDYVANSDELKQDETSYFNYYDANAVLTVELVIQKQADCGEFVDRHTITDNTYGIYRPLGDEVINSLNYISIKNINWSKILVDFGEGIYRIYTNEIDIFSEVANASSFTYELKNFTNEKAENTVFFKVSNSGSLGNRLDATERFAFPSNYEDGMRLPGRFGFDFDAYEKEYYKLNSGKKEYTKTTRTEKFLFKGRPLSEGPRKYFANELMMANLVEITDYNRNAANTHIKTPVHGNGEFSPVYGANTSKAYFEVEFTDAYDNQTKEHCNN